MDKYKLASKNSRVKKEIIINGFNFSTNFQLIPGPCAIENEMVIRKSAEFLNSQGIKAIRGGCWKPRTSPYDFQGEGEQAVRWAVRACLDFGIKVFVTEVVSVEADEIIDVVLKELDKEGKLVVVRQVGARNAQNFELLKHLGKKRNPVLLKRGLANTLEEFLSAAEYILVGGNFDVILCLRGHRLKDPDGNRFALDYEDFPVLDQMTWLPIIYDPSHSTGNKEKVLLASLEARQVGIRGLLVDVHPDSSIAKCDANQALSFEEFKSYLSQLKIN